DDFLLSKESCDKALLTAKVQQKIIFPKNSFSLYVSIPFCKTRCSYCSFVSSSINSKKSLELVDKYIDLLCEELKVTAEITKNKTLDTIYIGGGTPTAISATQLKKVTDTIAKYFPKPREYTIEAGRADTITKEKLEVIKQVANRISINPQSFEDNVLKAVGRAHTAQEVIACYNLARELGFDNINMDFIAGLPTDTVEGFKRSIDKAIELNPENITVHTLSIKRSADLYESVTALDGEIAKQMTDYSHKKLIENGYLPYYLYRQKNNIGNLENIGYCKKGYENIYNILIMDEVQTIVACGAGATTKLVSSTNISRVFNYKYHFEYINMFDEILKRKEEVRNFFKIGDIDSQIKTD
ncbi:MAG: coproporphyrinogen dehydrogenase HemZ, partial [Oscillospiraceae bacterium]